MIVALIIMIVLLGLAAISDIGHPPSGQQRAVGSVPPRITPAGQVPKPSPPARRLGV